MTDLRSQLFEAHVQHELARYRGAVLDERTRSWAREIFAWLAEVKIDEVITRERVMGIIERNVIALRVSGGIVELTGEMALLVLDSPASADTQLGELLPDADYERFAETVTRLQTLWRELIVRIAHSEAAESLHAQLLPRLLGDLVHDGGLLGRLAARFESRIADALNRYMGAHRQTMAERREHQLSQVLDPELVRSVVDELWLELSTKKLGELFQLISKQDLEDFVVLGHEFWLHYRRSPYFHRITREVLDHFFAKYGQQTVLAWIEDMGVSEAMVAHELRETLGPFFAEALRTGFLERQLRANLGSFYDSPGLRALLER
jgi:hypothetical protein